MKKGKVKSAELLPARWALAREFYVRGALRNGKPYFPSVRETAEFAGLSTSALRTTVKRDGWDHDREAYQADRERAFADELRRRAEAEGQQLAVQRARFDDDTFRLAAAAVRRAAEGLSVLRMQEPILNADGSPTGTFRVPRGAAYHLAQLTMALLNAQKAGRLVIGESTENIAAQLTARSVDPEMAQKSDQEIFAHIRESDRALLSFDGEDDAEHGFAH